MLELIKPTSIASVFLQMVNKQKSIFFSDLSSRTLAKNSMWKDWQRYLDNIRSVHAKLGPIFVGRLKEKSLKNVHLIHISWPELHIKQQMPHMFSRPVFIKLQSNTANIVGKDQRSNEKLNCFSNQKYQIHPLKKWLKRVDNHYQKLVIRNEFPISKFVSIPKVLLVFPFLVPSLSS